MQRGQDGGADVGGGENLSLILQQVMVVGVIAIGQTLIILTAGIDSSCGIGVTALTERDNPPAQLLSVASLFNLEQIYSVAGVDVTAANDQRALQEPWRQHTARWLADASAAIAQAVNCSACLLDLESVIIDGSFARELQAALIDETEVALSRYSWEGVLRPQLVAGSIGSDARALGGALLPLYANFMPDRELFLKV